MLYARFCCFCADDNFDKSKKMGKEEGWIVRESDKMKDEVGNHAHHILAYIHQTFPISKTLLLISVLTAICHDRENINHIIFLSYKTHNRKQGCCICTITKRDEKERKKRKFWPFFIIFTIASNLAYNVCENKAFINLLFLK